MENINKVPVHVSIIMDGNGRWAKERGRERVFGHLNGVESVRSVLEAAAEKGVKYLSLYAFSEENWGRPDEEVDYLMHLMMEALSKEAENLIRNGVKLVVLGNRARLGKVLNEAIDKVQEMTAANDRITLILFLSYSGRWDIFNAAKEMAEEAAAHPEKVAEMTPEYFENHLVTSGVPDPDLIIRTSGEQRLSNYLLWQGAYSEFYFTDVLWPDFRKEQFASALEAFSARDRRYGKIK